MDQASFQQARALFARLVDLPPAERLARLHQDCDDPAVIQLAEDLLAADASSRLLHTLSVGAGALAALADGTTFGDYHLHTPIRAEGHTRTWLATSRAGVSAVQVIEAWSDWTEEERHLTRRVLDELGRTRHPSLPGPSELVEVDGEAAWIGPPPRGEVVAIGSLRGVEIPRFLAQVAEVVGLLHERGVHHGRLGEAAFRRDRDRVVVEGYGPEVVFSGVDAASDLAELVALVRRASARAEGRFRRGLDEVLAAEVATATDLAAALREVEYGTNDTAWTPRPGLEGRLQRLTYSGDHEATVREVHGAREREGPQPLAVDQYLVIALSWLFRFDEAEAEAEALLARARAQGEVLEEVRIRIVQSFLQGRRCAYDDALANLEGAYALLRTLDEVPAATEGTLVRARAAVHAPAGRRRAQARDQRRAADLLLSSDSPGHRARGAYLRGELLHGAGDLREAEVAIAAAATLNAALGDRSGLADARTVLGRIQLRRGNSGAAIESGKAAVSILEDLGWTHFAVTAMLVVAVGCRRAGRLDEARAFAERALEATQLGWERTRIELELAVQRLVADDVAGARQHVARARSPDGTVPAAMTAWLSLVDLECTGAGDPGWPVAFRAVAEQLRQRALADDDVVDSLLRQCRHAPPERRVMLLDLALDRCAAGGLESSLAECRDELRALVEAGAPAVIDGLLVERTLGRGGMGVVLGARDPLTGDRVAIKVIEGAILEPSLVEAEIRAVAGLDHPGVVSVRGMGLLSEVAAHLADLPVGAPYLVMEWIEGGSLAADAGTLDVDEVVSIATQVLRTLAHVHARGVIHLDLKPANLLRDPARGVVLTDFGISRHGPDRAGVFAGGTPGFWAPEQEAGEALGPWTDLYGLGRTLQALLSGAPDGPLAAWMTRMVAPDPAERFQRASDALVALGVPPDTSEPPDHPLRVPDSPHLLLLREPPLVGRRAEREALWRLARAAKPGKPLRIHLVGPPGMGRSRLLRWLTEASREVGLPEPIPTSARSGDDFLVGPMDEHDLQELARSALGLSAPLADVLVARAAGNPRFLVGAAELEVRRGNLLLGARGITRISDPPDPLPDDLESLATAWLDLAVGPRKGDRLVQLEEAVASDPIHLDVWQATCEARDAEGDPDFLHRLAAAGLVVAAGPASWRWRHPWVAESSAGFGSRSRGL